MLSVMDRLLLALAAATLVWLLDVGTRAGFVKTGTTPISRLEAVAAPVDEGQPHRLVPLSR